MLHIHQHLKHMIISHQKSYAKAIKKCFSITFSTKFKFTLYQFYNLIFFQTSKFLCSFGFINMSFVLAYSFCACIGCDSFNNLTKSLMKPVTAVFIMSNQYICTPEKKINNILQN